MHIIDIRPRTPEWHQWRHHGIGASESAIILSRSPYKTPWQLWAEKCGLQLPPSLEHNPNVQRGIRLEPNARRYIELQHNELLLPLCGVSTQYPFLQASFDGINSLGEPVEIKCPSDTVFEQVKQDGMQSEAFALHAIQVQHQLLVSQQQRGWLMFYREIPSLPPELLTFEIQADITLQSELVSVAQEFWQRIVERKAPAKCPERDNFVPVGQDAIRWQQLAQDYHQLDKESLRIMDSLDVVKQRMKTLQSEFVQLMSGFAHADFAGIKVSRFWSHGAVDYGKLLLDLGHRIGESELIPYRKASTERLRVTVSQDTPLISTASSSIVSTQSQSLASSDSVSVIPPHSVLDEFPSMPCVDNRVNVANNTHPIYSTGYF